MRSLVIRADAGVAVGSGHVMRCLSLAEIFATKNVKVSFAASADTFNSVAALSDSSFGRFVLPSAAADEPAELKRQWPSGVDVMIVDHYQRDADFERACRAWARKIVVIDDLADRHHDADILIDAVNTAEAYRTLVSDECRLLCGPSFAITHARFPRRRPAALARRDGRPVERILVTFGQIDTPNMTSAALAALRMIGFEGAVDVAIGSAAPHLAGLRAAASSRVRLYTDANNLDELMASADIAIGAGGVTAWERCCLGLPSIISVIAENQRKQVAVVRNAGAGIVLPDPYDGIANDIAAALRRLIDENSLRMDMAHAAEGLVDGEGPRRIEKFVVD
jgi:UDP-2,4-diacetamido-2,4,6-trideoxy-beta-L-altropyranose hydrolase